jgi:hypothetical protein
LARSHQDDATAAFLVNAGQPLVLSGPPRNIRGQLQVQNRSDQKLVRSPHLSSARGSARISKSISKTLQSQPLLSEIVSLRRIVVRPHTHCSVPIALTLDPHTAPGMYDAHLQVEGEQRDVIVHVTEDLSFSMSPNSLTLANRPGETFERQVMFANHGNVPLLIKSIGAVVLDDELAVCRAVRGALHEAGAAMKSVDDLAVALGHQLTKVFGTQALKIENDKLTLEPGRSQLLDLSISLPEKLNARTRYTGYAAISTGNLDFTIVPE